MCVWLKNWTIKPSPTSWVQNAAGPCRTRGWVCGRVQWRHEERPGLGDVSCCTQKKKKSPFETITFVKGKGGFTGLWLITRTWHIKVGCGTGQTPQLSPKKCLEVFTVSLYCSNILNLDVTGKKMHSHIVEISEGQKNGVRCPPAGRWGNDLSDQSSSPLGIIILKRWDILRDILICPLLLEYSIMFWPNSALTFILSSSKAAH